jgi:hypothetical protein
MMGPTNFWTLFLQEFWALGEGLWYRRHTHAVPVSSGL